MARPENKRMQEFLKANGIKAKAKYLPNGSLKHTWLLYNPDLRWTEEFAAQVNALGFVDYDHKPLGKFSGNGGVMSIYVRGHYELLGGDRPLPPGVVLQSLPV